MQYIDLCSLYEKLESTTKRLEKTKLLADFLKETPHKEIEHIVLLVQGLVYPIWDERKLGFGANYIIKSIAMAAGISAEKVKDKWRETGDLGLAAERLVSKKAQSTLTSGKLTTEKVFSNLQKIADIEGKGSVDSKVGLVVDLLTQASPLEARFIVRNVLDELRVGLGEGTLRDAFVWAFLPKIAGITTDERKGKGLNIKSEEDFSKAENYDYIYSNDASLARLLYNKFVVEIQRALDCCNDFSVVAHALISKGLKGLEKLSISPGSPLKVMLAIKEKTFAGAFEQVGKPAAVEHKLDGFRLQIHKEGNEIKLFTRQLENVTTQFPDVVKAVSKHIKAKNVIIDSEAVGIDSKGKFLPFQNISQRIKRKYDIEQLAKSLPVQLHAFDILYYNDKNLINTPFKERRRILSEIVDSGENLKLVKQLITSDEAEAEKFYEEALKLGVEGVMFKNLEAPYKPGARVGYMIKMKPTMETLDLVIVEAEWGEGKRGAWLSSYTVACRDGEKLLIVGKVSTGLKEKSEEGLSFADLTKELKPLVISASAKLVKVKPKIVIEVLFEEIQKSPAYSSGYALRFPRVVRLRPDRDASDCSGIKDVRRMYEGQ